MIEREDEVMAKKLCRVQSGKMLCGVCAGVAKYFDLDVSLVRLAWVAVSILSGSGGFWVYLIAALILPDEEVG